MSSFFAKFSKVTSLHKRLVYFYVRYWVLEKGHHKLQDVVITKTNITFFWISDPKI